MLNGEESELKFINVANEKVRKQTLNSQNLQTQTLLTTVTTIYSRRFVFHFWVTSVKLITLLYTSRLMSVRPSIPSYPTRAQFENSFYETW